MLISSQNDGYRNYGVHGAIIEIFVNFVSVELDFKIRCYLLDFANKNLGRRKKITACSLGFSFAKHIK